MCIDILSRMNPVHYFPTDRMVNSLGYFPIELLNSLSSKDKVRIVEVVYDE